MNAQEQPSYKSGYARERSQSEFPTLWNGLVAAWVPKLGPTGAVWNDTGSSTRVWVPDLISGAKLTIANDAATDRFPIQDGGYAFRHDAGDTYSSNFRNYSSKFTKEATLVMRCKYNALNNGNGFGFGPGSGLRTHYPYTGSLNYFSTFTTTTRPISGVATVGPVTVWHTLAIVTSPGASNYIYYYNGKLGNTGTGPATISGMNSATLLSTGGSPYCGLKGYFSGAYLYNRALTPIEIRTISSDILNPLKLKRRTSVLIPAGGGGGGFQAAWASRATQIAGVTV